MRKRLLNAALAAIGLAALVAGGTAAAGGKSSAALVTAKLTITPATQSVSGAGYRIKFSKAQADGDVARVVIYVPQGYQVVTSQTAGTQVGTAAATVFSRDLNAVVPVTGTVEIANPADFTLQATACTGTATHTQELALRLQAAGTPLTVPAFVDTITAPPLSAIAAATITFCLPPSDIPPGPNRAALGASVLTADFTTTTISSPTTRGEYRWRALATPYQAGNGQVDAAGTVEAQSLVELPTQVTLKAKLGKVAKGVRSVSFSGTLLAALKGVGSATVDIYKGSTAAGVKKFKSQTTDSNGAFSGKLAVKTGKRAAPLYLLAKAKIADQDLGSAGCTATFVPPISPVPIPCVDATIGGVSVASSTVKVTIPAGPKK
jgi:hypothetical protein